MFDWPGNSADLTPIEEVRKIIKKRNILSFQTIRKTIWNNSCNLWYGIHRETIKKGYDEMPSTVEAVPKAKMGLPCTEMLKTMAENDKKYFELLYGTTHIGKRIQFQ